MRTVALGDTGVVTSQLGYGCSALLGPHSRAEAIALLEAALASGITHFDVARSYGSGDAEGVVGAFLRGRRDQVTVTTKFGILPPVGVARSRALRFIARRAMRLSPAVRQTLGRRGARMTTSSQFAPAAATSSIEASLGALDIDTIDVLLLHEPSVDDCAPELLALLEGLVKGGLIRTFGVGAEPEHALAIARDAPGFARVVQVPGDLRRRGRLDTALYAPGAGVITHGALVPAALIRSRLNADPSLERRWSAELAVDFADGDVLGRLLLAHALDVNPSGPVLFRTVQPHRIASNAAAATEDPKRTRRFASLAVDLLGELPQT